VRARLLLQLVQTVGRVRITFRTFVARVSRKASVAAARLFSTTATLSPDASVSSRARIPRVSAVAVGAVNREL
jgi:hypothetical protein